MLQRHVGPRLSNSDYPTSGDGGVAAGATVMPTRSPLARDNDPMDYDMPEDLNAAMLISPRTHPTTVTSLEDPVNPQPIQDVIHPDGTIDPPRRQHDMQTKNLPSNRNPFGNPRPPRPKKKPPVRDKISHHQRSDAAGQGTRPSAQSKR